MVHYKTYRLKIISKSEFYLKVYKPMWYYIHIILHNKILIIIQEYKGVVNLYNLATL